MGDRDKLSPISRGRRRAASGVRPSSRRSSPSPSHWWAWPSWSPSSPPAPGPPSSATRPGGRWGCSPGGGGCFTSARGEVGSPNRVGVPPRSPPTCREPRSGRGARRHRRLRRGAAHRHPVGVRRATPFGPPTSSAPAGRRDRSLSGRNGTDAGAVDAPRPGIVRDHHRRRHRRPVPGVGDRAPPRPTRTSRRSTVGITTRGRSVFPNRGDHGHVSMAVTIATRLADRRVGEPAGPVRDAGRSRTGLRTGGRSCRPSQLASSQSLRGVERGRTGGSAVAGASAWCHRRGARPEMTCRVAVCGQCDVCGGRRRSTTRSDAGPESRGTPRNCPISRGKPQ